MHNILNISIIYAQPHILIKKKTFIHHESIRPSHSPNMIERGSQIPWALLIADNYYNLLFSFHLRLL